MNTPTCLRRWRKWAGLGWGWVGGEMEPGQKWSQIDIFLSSSCYVLWVLCVCVCVVRADILELCWYVHTCIHNFWYEKRLSKCLPSCFSWFLLLSLNCCSTSSSGCRMPDAPVVMCVCQWRSEGVAEWRRNSSRNVATWNYLCEISARASKILKAFFASHITHSSRRHSKCSTNFKPLRLKLNVG